MENKVSGKMVATALHKYALYICIYVVYVLYVCRGK